MKRPLHLRFMFRVSMASGCDCVIMIFFVQVYVCGEEKLFKNWG